MKYKERIQKLITTLKSGLYERGEIVALSLLALLSGQSVFLFGLPGTAKSLIARRISLAFKNSEFFENLMNRFTTPEDIFGPIDIKELKEARYKRKTLKFLPRAAVAFLDEIWKSGTAILNSLLTIINERKFRNGDEVEDVPLKGIISASNEIPPEGQGLEALYDRFIIRLLVKPLQKRENFELLLNAEPVSAVIPVDESLQFSDEEWEDLMDLSKLVDISKESFDIIHSVRTKIDHFNTNNKDKLIYISDRRWQKIALILKTSACLCDRDTVLPVDVLVLKNCLWTKEGNRESLAEMVEDSVREFCPYNSDKYEQWLDILDDLKSEVEETFFYNSDVYEAHEEVNGEKCFRTALAIPYCERKHDSWGGYSSEYEEKKKNINIYIPFKFLKKSTDFQALGEDGNEINTITCNFNGTAKVSIKVAYEYRANHYNSSQTKYATYSWEISPAYKKGDCKKVTSRTKNMYKKNVQAHIEQHKEIAKEINAYYIDMQERNKNPFVSEKDQGIVTAAIQEYLKGMEVGMLDAEQLLSKLNNHVDA